MGKEATLCTGAGSAALGTSLLTKKTKGKSGKVSLRKKLKSVSLVWIKKMTSIRILAPTRLEEGKLSEAAFQIWTTELEVYLEVDTKYEIFMQ